MNEKILRIEETTFTARTDGPFKDFDQDCDGYEIITDQQKIQIGVSNDQNCCERWGYMVSEDSIQDFIGAELLGIEVVDTARNVTKWEEKNPYGLDSGDVMFVNVNTNRGTFQIAVYNSHNGYYGHTGYVISKQLTEWRRL
jgi:hypothetical protein